MLAAFLATLAALDACDVGVPGVPTQREELHAAADALAMDWAQDATLPPIDTPRCQDALEGVDIREATEREWIDELRLCPMMPDGCSAACGRGVTGCVAGVVYWMGGRPRVFLSPGETADGHVIAVRHEVAHVLSWCTDRGLDYAHAHADVWGADGIVWEGE
jgi:hypothetical protein